MLAILNHCHEAAQATVNDAAFLLPAAVLLFCSGILTYAVLRRR